MAVRRKVERPARARRVAKRRTGKDTSWIDGFHPTPKGKYERPSTASLSLRPEIDSILTWAVMRAREPEATNRLLSMADFQVGLRLG